MKGEGEGGEGKEREGEERERKENEGRGGRRREKGGRGREGRRKEKNLKSLFNAQCFVCISLPTCGKLPVHSLFPLTPTFPGMPGIGRSRLSASPSARLPPYAVPSE